MNLMVKVINILSLFDYSLSGRTASETTERPSNGLHGLFEGYIAIVAVK